MDTNASLFSAVVAGFAIASLLGGCHDPDSFLSPGDPAVMTLEVGDDPAEIPADGFSRIGIVARISSDAASANRDIVFSTTAGTFLGTTAANATLEVTVDSDGLARVELQSGNQSGTARVTAKIKGKTEINRSVDVEFTEVDPGDVMRFVVAPDVAPADGATQSEFSVQISDGLPEGSRTVKFATTAGKFSGKDSIDVPADASGIARAVLTSPAGVGSAIVSATINKVIRDADIQFARALPDRILVSLDKLQLPAKAGESIQITGQLARDVGKVTVGTPPTFLGTGASGERFDTFYNATLSDAQERVTGRFTVGGTSYRGPVTITVGVEGSTVTGTAQIEIVDPSSPPAVAQPVR